ncbi:MAG TPA: hypothetical protein VLM38_18840 [Blastocatellia bacterium]|nr:hypothetical protein [Blastocatellia bacterium]
MIDEADKPELLSFEVNQHIRRCRDCETFADQRAGLRTLLASGTRVTAPINFDAVLNARLAEVKSRRSFAWLSSAGYLRLGAATAGLVVMIFAAQYTGLFSRDAERVPAPQDMAAVAPKPVPLRPGASTVEPPEVQHVVASVPRATIGARGGTPIGARVMPRGYSAAEDGGVVLVRGTNGEMDVPMPTVSVGAQPLLYVSAGKQPARGVGASF